MSLDSMSFDPVATFERGSFRDRSGRVFLRHGQVFRALGHDGRQDWDAVSQKAFLQTAMQSGCIVRTDTVADVAPPFPGFDCTAVLHHATIAVITWPFEWSFNMPRSAALLTLELMEQALRDDAILKDATPYNIQYVGSCPVFIDTSSIVPFEPVPTRSVFTRPAACSTAIETDSQAQGRRFDEGERIQSRHDRQQHPGIAANCGAVVVEG